MKSARGKGEMKGFSQTASVTVVDQDVWSSIGHISEISSFKYYCCRTKPAKTNLDNLVTDLFIFALDRLRFLFLLGQSG